MEWLKDLKKEELPENYQEMLTLLMKGNDQIGPTITDEVLAFRVVLALSVHYNKQPFYFSGIDAIVARKKRDFVLRNRGRIKVSDLVRITGLAQRSIYEIFEEVAAKKQKDLFEKEGCVESGIKDNLT